MKPIRYQEDVKEFLKQVCSHIRAKEVHREVQMELEGHLQDIIEEKLDRGIALNTAIKEAMTQMGAPDLSVLSFIRYIAHGLIGSCLGFCPSSYCLGLSPFSPLRLHLSSV